jgi:hypothetical protein
MLAKHLNLPMKSPKDIRPHLGNPIGHWREKFSAVSLAYAWTGQDGFPASVNALFQTSAVFGAAELVDGFFERQTSLEDGIAGFSQTDLLVIARINAGLAVIAVEGKCIESFDKTVAGFINKDVHQEKRIARVEGLCNLLGIKRTEADDLRYQLFHRTAAAVLEAKRYAASTALLLIHSFGSGDRSQSEENRHAQNRNDYEAFLDKIGMRDREAERVNGPIMIDGVALYSAWIDEGFPLIPSEYSEIQCTFNKNTPCQIQLPKE